MNIVFICGCIEPGKDGVGDYTRRLAGALICAGHKASIIGINDPAINDSIVTVQHAEGSSIDVFRIASSLPPDERYKKAESWISNLKPDFISLQYVPFAFDKRGLHFGLSKQLLKLSKGIPWHLMIHELWVGMAKESGKKLLWWGKLQRALIRSLIKKIKPVVIHTQTQLYKAHLLKLGFDANILPLFTNIPAVKNSVEQKDLTGNLSFVIFGVIHEQAPIKELAHEVAEYANEKQIDVSLTFIGRSGNESARWINEWESAGLKWRALNEQPASYISQVLSESSIGIATTAYAVVEKSGSVAAMRSHGLPVMCVSPSWTPTGVKYKIEPDGVWPYKKGSFKEYVSNVTPELFINNVQDTAIVFLNDIAKHHLGK